MKQNFTHDLLMLHLYNETTPAERVEITKELVQSESLQAEWLELQQSQNLLSSDIKSPSLTSLRIIMEHSYKTEHLQEI